MRAAIVTMLFVTAGILAAAAGQTRPQTLDIYYIDTEGGQSTLFVSHITIEAPIAAVLKKIIAEDFIGIVDLFTSSDVTSIQGGEKWLDTIRAAIAESAAVLVLCSESSINRPWVQFEIGAAWATGKRIIPICQA